MNKKDAFFFVIRKKYLSCRRNRKLNVSYGKTKDTSGIPSECNV